MNTLNNNTQKNHQVATPNIHYGLSENAWKNYDAFLKDLIDRFNSVSVCDVGGGANPVLDSDYVTEKELKYYILDISEVELKKAPENYHKLEADIAAPQFTINQKFDLVFSKMLAEHIKDAKQFHTNIWGILNDGGFAVHFFPTLFTLPFLVNYLTPEILTTKILDLVSPRDKYQHGKFPAYYNWCRGPHKRQIRRFINIGFEIVEYWGFFGHSSYYQKIKFMKNIHQVKTNYLLNHPNPYLTSFAYLILRKPDPSLENPSNK